MRVFVYRNLHRDCFSVRDEATGRIVLHTKRLVLSDAKLVVQPAGRARVLAERRKNVHAGVRGTLVDLAVSGPAFRDGFIEARYNPYEAGTFLQADTGVPLDGTYARAQLAFPKVFVQP